MIANFTAYFSPTSYSILAFVLLTAATASALTNGDFESGLSGWTTAGAATTIGSFGTSGIINPVSGNNLLQLTAGGVSASTMETYLVAVPGSIDNIVSGTPYSGAIAYQFFTLTNSAKLSFSWNFLDAEALGGSLSFKDTAFYSLNGSVNFLADVDSPQSSVAQNGGSSYQHNGFQTKTISLSAGLYSVGFGVVNGNDNNVQSILLVDDVKLTLSASFRAGMNANGGFGIENTSEPGLSLSSVKISLTNDTFFDTASTPPGTSSTGWSQINATGGASATLPSDASTDGQTSATVIFTSLDPGDAVNLGMDLDTYSNPDNAGNPLDTEVEATFSDGSKATIKLSNASATINGAPYSYTGTSLSVPEPSTGLLCLLGVGIWAVGSRWRLRGANHLADIKK